MLYNLYIVFIQLEKADCALACNCPGTSKGIDTGFGWLLAANSVQGEINRYPTGGNELQVQDQIGRAHV